MFEISLIKGANYRDLTASAYVGLCLCLCNSENQSLWTIIRFCTNMVSVPVIFLFLVYFGAFLMKEFYTLARWIYAGDDCTMQPSRRWPYLPAVSELRIADRGTSGICGTYIFFFTFVHYLLLSVSELWRYLFVCISLGIIGLLFRGWRSKTQTLYCKLIKMISFRLTMNFKIFLDTYIQTQWTRRSSFFSLL